MIYFAGDDVFLSVISFFLLGIISGGVRSSFFGFFVFLKECISIPKFCYAKYKNKKIKRIKIGQNIKSFKISLHLLDFCFFAFFGIFFILFSYLFLDGVFRIYSLIIFTAGFFMGENSLGKIFSKALFFVLNLTVVTLDFFVYFLLYPIFIAADIIKRLFLPIILLVKQKYKKYSYKCLLKKKVKEIENLNF